MRRIAWNAWRSCSADSCSTCSDSLASKADAGMDALAALGQQRR